MTQRGEIEGTDVLAKQFGGRGVAVVEYALTQDDIARMEQFFPVLPARTAGARADHFSGEARAYFAAHKGLMETAARLGGTAMALSRLQAFDKSPLSNWFVPWHQDRAEDGRERAVPYLENTLALRIHLDACGEDDGPLEVLAGSHTKGRLTADMISAHVESGACTLCLAARGDIVAMRPLLLHRSQRARAPAARRVIHIEYTSRAYLERACRAALAS